MAEPITLLTCFIAKLLQEGKKSDEIIDYLKIKGEIITREDIRKGVELSFYMNIPNSITWEDINNHNNGDNNEN